MVLSPKKWSFLAVLGEIAIIIIGILLSLAISEWFGDRKDARREMAYLTQLSGELENDLGQLRAEMTQREGQLESARAVLEMQRRGIGPADGKTIASHLRALTFTVRFSPNDATFSTLESTGQLALIDRPEITTRLLDLYDNQYESVNLNNQDVTDFRNAFLLPYLVNELDFNFAVGRPGDIEKLGRALASPVLTNQLIYFSISLQSTVLTYERTLTGVEETLRLVRAEVR